MHGTPAFRSHEEGTPPWGEGAAVGWSLGDSGLCGLGDTLRLATNTPACITHEALEYTATTLLVEKRSLDNVKPNYRTPGETTTIQCMTQPSL